MADAVRRSSLNLASGEIRTDAGDLLLRTNTKRERGEEFEDIVLRGRPDGAILRLGDVAIVRDGFEEVDLVNEYNGRASIFVRVRKSEAEDVLAIAEDVKAMLADYRPPPGIDVAIWSDQTEVLEDRLNLLIRNGVLGFALVFLFLVVMLDMRLAMWVAMGGAHLLPRRLSVLRLLRRQHQHGVPVRAHHRARHRGRRRRGGGARTSSPSRRRTAARAPARPSPARWACVPRWWSAC